MAKRVSQVGIPSEIAALAPLSLGQGSQQGRELEIAGASLVELGVLLHKKKVATDVANGTAAYNKLFDDYTQGITSSDKPISPGSYVPGYEKALAKNKGKIFKGMSRDAVDVLNNKFIVWDQMNKAALGRAAIARGKVLALDAYAIEAISIARSPIQSREEFAETLLNDVDLTPTQRKQFLSIHDKEAERMASNFVRAAAKQIDTLDNAIDFIESAGLKAGLPKETITWLRTAETADRSRTKDAEDKAHEDKLETISDDMAKGVVEGVYDITPVLLDPTLTAKERTAKIAEYKAFSTATTPQESDFDAIDRVQTAIDAFTTGASVLVKGKPVNADKAYARNILKDNYKSLNSADRTRYTNELYGAQDKTYNTHRTDGRFYLKSKLLTGTSLMFGAISIPIASGPKEKQQYENASILLDIQLNDWRKSGKWPNPVEFYEQTQVIINNVKNPNFTLNDPAQVEGRRLQAKEKRDIRQDIFEQMTPGEQDTALEALRQGKTPQEIIDFFEANK